MPEKVVIIGSGPAGWTAAIYAARAELQPLLFEGAISSENQTQGTLPMGQLALTSEVENFPGFPPGSVSELLNTSISKDRLSMLPPNDPAQIGVSGPQLVELIRAQAVHFGTRIVTEDIIDVDFSQKSCKLTSSSGKIYETKSVIIATGARANYLGLPSETAFKNRGVSACATCDGALPRFRNKEIVVIGGGDSAVEEADSLTKFASKVYIVHRRNELRASKIMAKRALEHPKIEVLWNRTLKEVLGNDKDGVTGVVLASSIGESDLQKSVTGVFLGIGHTPNTAFLNGKLDADEHGFLVRPVPFRSNSSVPGVFLAGDVTDGHYRQAITAAGTGCMAALDAERYISQSEL